MLAAVAVVALVVGGVQTALIATDQKAVQAEDNRAPVVEVQRVETVNPFTE